MINLRELIAEYIYKYMINLEPVNEEDIFWCEDFKVYKYKEDFNGDFNDIRPQYPVMVFNTEIDGTPEEIFTHFIYCATMNITDYCDVFKKIHDGLDFLVDLERNKNPNHKMEYFEVFDKHVQPYNKINIKYLVKNKQEAAKPIEL